MTAKCLFATMYRLEGYTLLSIHLPQLQPRLFILLNSIRWKIKIRMGGKKWGGYDSFFIVNIRQNSTPSSVLRYFGGEMVWTISRVWIINYHRKSWARCKTYDRHWEIVVSMIPLVVKYEIWLYTILIVEKFSKTTGFPLWYRSVY